MTHLRFAYILLFVLLGSGLAELPTKNISTTAWALTAGISPLQGIPDLNIMDNSFWVLRWQRQLHRAWQVGLWWIPDPAVDWSVESLETDGYRWQKRTRLGFGAATTIQHVWFVPFGERLRGSIAAGPALGAGWWTGNLQYEREEDLRYVTLSATRLQVGVATTVNVEWFMSNFASLNAVWLMQALIGRETMQQEIWDSRERHFRYDQREISLMLVEFVQSQLFLGITLYWGGTVH